MISGHLPQVKCTGTTSHKTIKSSASQIIKPLPNQRQAITHDNKGYILGLL